MPKPLLIDSIETAVTRLLETVEGDIVLGTPLGVGKPNPFINALYRRIKANPARRLRIITALSLEKPEGHSELERHFLEPLVARVFADYPDLEYVKDLRGAGLPANIEVHELFMKTGDYLHNDAAQQGYISSNYTHIARDMMVQGMNVIAQAVAAHEDGGGLHLSLSSNPDVVFEVIEKFRAAKQPLVTVGVVNHKMPFMPNTAAVEPGFFDIVVTDPLATHAVFGPPNNKVSMADYAIGLHASSLVADGGTLQIGIGSLGDAIAQALIVRDRHVDEYRRILETLCPDGIGDRDLSRFDSGLYGCSEMFVNGFLKLIEAGIIRREVFGDAVLQQLLNEGAIDETVTPDMLRALLARRRIRSPARRRGPRLPATQRRVQGGCAHRRQGSRARRSARCQRPARAGLVRRRRVADARRAPDARHLHDGRLLPRPERLLRAAAHDATAGAGEDRHDAHRLHQPALWQRGD